MLVPTCFFAIVFAAALLGVLEGVGLRVTPSVICPADTGCYSCCAFKQDVRSVMSFVLGVFACILPSTCRGQSFLDESREPSDKHLPFMSLML